ncbi:hypothetical protein RCL1_007412 [Eukaryota sp. TZLM3-RCL]
MNQHNPFFTLILPIVQTAAPTLHPDVQLQITNLLFYLFYGQLTKDQYVQSISLLVPQQLVSIFISPNFFAPVQQQVTLLHQQFSPTPIHPLPPPPQQPQQLIPPTTDLSTYTTWEPSMSFFSSQHFPIDGIPTALLEIVVNVVNRNSVSISHDCLHVIDFALIEIISYALRTCLFASKIRQEPFENLNSNLLKTTVTPLGDLTNFLKIVSEAESQLREKAVEAIKAKEEKEKKQKKEGKKSGEEKRREGGEQRAATEEILKTDMEAIKSLSKLKRSTVKSDSRATSSSTSRLRPLIESKDWKYFVSNETFGPIRNILNKFS